MKTGLRFIFAFFLLDCADNHAVAQKNLEGKWVHVETKTDTLTFLTVSDHDYVQLDRGSEMRNGVLRPKNGTGRYHYKILTDKISLRWTLSASAGYNDYYFYQSGDSLVIGKFYDLDSKWTKLTFEKLK